MSVYYNEIDKFAAQWLRNLIRAKLIPEGDVDERSILDVRPVDLKPYIHCHFFAGIGGWPYALGLAAWPLDREVWTGSCPCQPFSAAGRRRGFADERHLWPYWRYLIEQCRPATIFGEQVASAAEWLRLVRGDLEALDYAVGAIPVEAASAGADHLRDRFWIVAHDESSREGRGRVCGPEQGFAAFAERASDKLAGSGFDFNLANNNTRSQGRALSTERAGERSSRPDGMAHPDLTIRWVGDQQPAGQFAQQQQPDQETRDSGTVANAIGERCGNGTGLPTERREDLSVFAGRDGSSEFSWVLGADGKARRVKSRLCVRPYGLPGAVAGMFAAAEYKEKIDGAQTQIDAAAPLFAMRSATSAADVSERAGRFNGVLSPQILQSEMYGDVHAAVKSDSGGEQAAGAEISQRAVLRGMQDDTATARASQGRQPAQQHTIEFADFMRFLPSAETLARLEKDTQTCEALSSLRAACEGLWPVSKTLSSLEEIWRSLPDQVKRKVWADHGEGHFVISSIQLLVQNFTGRIGALKGFGNAIDPRPAAEIIKTFLEYRP